MSTLGQLIDGKAVANDVLEECRTRITALKARGVTPCLTVIRVGDDPASVIYVNGKIADCKKVGMASQLIHLSETIDRDALLAEVEKCNQDPAVHGILVQLPLPAHLDEHLIIQSIDPRKDADGFHPNNAATLFQGSAADLDGVSVACTPAGVMRLLQSTDISLTGKHAVVIGRSNIVGKPMAMLLLQQHCTVTLCHSRTADLEAEVRRADIIVAAVGKSELVRMNWVKQGAVVVDVGMNRNAAGKLTGDVAFDEVRSNASWITPVPGGVGPMTRAMLLANTLTLAEKQYRA